MILQYRLLQATTPPNVVQQLTAAIDAIEHTVDPIQKHKPRYAVSLVANYSTDQVTRYAMVGQPEPCKEDEQLIERFIKTSNGNNRVIANVVEEYVTTGEELDKLTGPNQFKEFHTYACVYAGIL